MVKSFQDGSKIYLDRIDARASGHFLVVPLREDGEGGLALTGFGHQPLAVPAVLDARTLAARRTEVLENPRRRPASVECASIPSVCVSTRPGTPPKTCAVAAVARPSSRRRRIEKTIGRSAGSRHSNAPGRPSPGDHVVGVVASTSTRGPANGDTCRGALLPVTRIISAAGDHRCGRARARRRSALSRTRCALPTSALLAPLHMLPKRGAIAQIIRRCAGLSRAQPVIEGTRHYTVYFARTSSPSRRPRGHRLLCG